MPAVLHPTVFSSSEASAICGKCNRQLAAQVYSRRGKRLLALQAVRRAAALGGPGDPDAHRLAVRFCLAARAHANGAAPQARPCAPLSLPAPLHCSSLAYTAFLVGAGAGTKARMQGCRSSQRPSCPASSLGTNLGQPCRGMTPGNGM